MKHYKILRRSLLRKGAQFKEYFVPILYKSRAEVELIVFKLNENPAFKDKLQHKVFLHVEPELPPATP